MTDRDEFYAHNKGVFEELRRNSYQAQIDYGKWLIASLLLVHGGSIFAIAQLGKDGVQLFSMAGPWFVAGIMFALLSGMFTWFNFSFAIAAYHAASGAVVSGNDPYEVLKPHIRKIQGTLYLAVSFALLSASMIVVGAWRIFLLLDTMEHSWLPAIMRLATHPLFFGG